MAGDWIKLETTTPDKPEVYRIADALGGIDPDAVLGKLTRVWIWADQQTFDGNASSVTRSLVDRITGVAGFADAMLNCGWLREHEAGLMLPNFDRHNGKTAKTRALTRNRVAKKRNADVTVSALPREEIENRDIDTSSTDVDGVRSRSKKNKRASKEPSADFEKWWAHYPRKVGKQDAWNAFPRALEVITEQESLGTDAALEWLTARTKAYAESVRDRELQHVKHPGPWLNGKRFNDQLAVSRPGSGASVVYHDEPMPKRTAPQRSAHANA